MEDRVIDIAGALNSLGEGWGLGGSVTAGTRACWDALPWEDARLKPTWDDLVSADARRMRADLTRDIGARKNALRDGGFVLDGVLWDSDAGARIAYAELAQRLVIDPSFTARWKASEGQWVTMSATFFAAVYAAGAAHIASAFAWQEAEEARLAATPDEELSEFVVSPTEES